MGSVRGLIPVEFLLIMHALPLRLPSREERTRERRKRLESVREAKDRAREIDKLQGREKGTPKERERKVEEGRRQQEGPSVRGRRYASPASPLSLLQARSPSRYAHPRLPRGAAVLPSAGRFTYKFNKHISYLMHALSRECFDRPGPPFSSSTRSSAQRSAPRAPPRAQTLRLIAHFLLLGFVLPDGTPCRKQQRLIHARLSLA